MRRGRAVRHLSDDSGVAGLAMAIMIMIVSFTALTVFVSKHTGPIHELAKLKNVGGQEKILKASLMVYFNQFGEMPCPDADQDGDEDACSGGAATSGTLPWSTMGSSKDDAIDTYGTYYTYVVADTSKDLCISIPNDYDDTAAPEFTGESLPFEDLQVMATTAGATGTYVPFALISHGKNRLGGISGSSGTPIADPDAGFEELVNATANPTTIYTGPYDTDAETYFDDSVWAPATSDLAGICEQKTPGGALNADLTEDFAGDDGDVDQDKFDTVNGGPEVQQEGGEAVFANASAYMTTAGSYTLNSTERPLYISADWTPDAGAAAGGFSIVTRANATPTASTLDATDVFDPGITFRFFSSAAEGANTISIMNNGAAVATSAGTFTMDFGQTYLLEVYDNGTEAWIQITEKNLTSNRAYAHATSVTGDTTGTRVAIVNGTASESRLDNLVVGRPTLALDTRGAGYVETTGNQNGTNDDALTLEGWFRPRSLPTGVNTATLISQWDSLTPNTTGSFRLFMSAGGALSLSLGTATGNTTDTETLGASLAVDTWTHVAVTYDPDVTNGEVTVYIDGELVNTITGQTLSGNDIRNATEHFVVGANLNGTAGQNFYDGMVSDVRVWNAVRDADEIATWYDRRLPLVNADNFLDTLRVNWRLDRESGGFASTQALEEPGSAGSPGNLVGTATWAGALLFTHRPDSTAICSGFRVGAFRCDYRTTAAGNNTNITVGIDGEDLGGMATFYAKVWGGGGGADMSADNDGGGGGFAGALFANTGQDVDIRVGRGGNSAANGQAGADSYLDQGSQRVTGNLGGAGTNSVDGTSGIGEILGGGTYITSTIFPTVGDTDRQPGCVPAITVLGNPCTDEHYTLEGAEIEMPGYGADGSLVTPPGGQSGAVVLLW